jgi:hypothetical protein
MLAVRVVPALPRPLVSARSAAAAGRPVDVGRRDLGRHGRAEGGQLVRELVLQGQVGG